MNRRDFVWLGWATVIATGAGKLRPAFAQSPAHRQVLGPPQDPKVATLEPKAHERAADFTLRIAPMMVELAPQVVLSTVGYSNQVPGPLLRVREGQPVAVEVVNDTDVPEYVHWHGLFVPPGGG
ncbi:MAG: multicopper oxidase domain-containing protein [Bryobacteraceae bacterium]